MLIVVGFPWSYIKQASKSRAQKTARRCGVKGASVYEPDSADPLNTAKQERARIVGK
jgi:hypothetical protein